MEVSGYATVCHIYVVPSNVEVFIVEGLVDVAHKLHMSK
jgi:hypothetical protein